VEPYPQQVNPQRIGLVGCVKGKLPHAARARDLYVSPLFIGRRRYVERSCDSWYILSAKHGLVHPDALLDPYDQTLVGASVAERRRWGEMVLRQVDAELGPVKGCLFEVHAGSAYLEYRLVDGLRARGAAVERPAGRRPIGALLAFYGASSIGTGEDPGSPGAAGARPVGSSAGRSKYAPIGHALWQSSGYEAAYSFTELERLLGQPFRAQPASIGPGGLTIGATRKRGRGWTRVGV
jgi:hypothetical protein